MEPLENLLNLSWELLLTNGGAKKWLVKFYTSEQSYQFAVTDMATVFLETMDKDAILNRLKCENKLLEAPYEKVVQHLKCSIQEHHQHHFVSEFTENGVLNIKLTNTFGPSVPFNWKFHCSAHNTESSSVTKQLLCVPLVRSLTSLLLENSLLHEILKKKDAEISDYKENGAQVSRPYLETIPFVQETFVKDMRTSKEYAVAITKDPLFMLSHKPLNQIIESAVNDSVSKEIHDILSAASNSPAKSVGMSSTQTVSPSKLRATKRKKPKPQHRGAYVDDDTVVEENSSDSLLNTKTNATKSLVPVVNSKPRKRQKKGLF